MSLSSFSKRRVASRYAKALFDVALEKSDIDTVADTVSAVAQLVEESQEFRQLCFSPIIPAEEKAKAIQVLAKQSGLSTVVSLWLMTMAENNRLEVLPEAKAAYDELVRQYKGEVQAHVISAKKLKVADSKAITDAISNAMGKAVVPVFAVDKELIGGVKVRIGSRELDASVKGKLARAAERLYEGIQR